MSQRTSSNAAFLGVLALVGLVVAGCSSTYSKMSHSWVDPTHSKTPIKKIFVIGLAQDPTMRRVFETKMSAILEESGVTAVASSGIMPELGNLEDKEGTKNMVRAAVQESGADAVTVTRLLSAETSEHYVQGSSYVVPTNYYGGFNSYYYNSYEVVSTPGYVVQDQTYVVETNLYDVATEKLIWTGISETLNPDSSIDGLESVGKIVVYTLKKEGLIAKK